MKPHNGEAHQQLSEIALAVAALGMLTDRAVTQGLEQVIAGEDNDGRRKKVMGLNVAAFWVESIRDWSQTREDLEIEVGEHYEGGWPEFKVGNKYHLRVNRYDRPDRSARSAAMTRQAPDRSLGWWQDTLPGLEPSYQSPVNVNMVAEMDALGHIVGLEWFAPSGPDELLFHFVVDHKEAERLAAQWEQERPQWVEHLLRLAALQPTEQTVPTPVEVGVFDTDVRRQFSASDIPGPEQASEDSAVHHNTDDQTKEQTDRDSGSATATG